MKSNDREKLILKFLDKNESIVIDDIVKNCDVSAITARRDLVKLEKLGYAIRTHGGAVRGDAVTGLFSFANRNVKKKEQKLAICKLAAKQYIKDDDTIFIDCGTTLFRLCEAIHKKKNLRVITNSLAVASELIKYPEITVILIGGEMICERRATYGSISEKQICDYHADKAFIGTDGISHKNGLSSYDEKEGQITKRMAESSDVVYLLCDSSKFEKDSFYKYAPLSIVDHIITDKDIDEKILETYLKRKISVLLA